MLPYTNIKTAKAAGTIDYLSIQESTGNLNIKLSGTNTIEVRIFMENMELEQNALRPMEVVMKVLRYLEGQLKLLRN